MLPSLAAQVHCARADKIKALEERKVLPNITLTLDGWSTAMMESLIVAVALFSDREVWVLGAEDASMPKHTAEFIRGK